MECTFACLAARTICLNFIIYCLLNIIFILVYVTFQKSMIEDMGEFITEQDTHLLSQLHWSGITNVSSPKRYPLARAGKWVWHLLARPWFLLAPGKWASGFVEPCKNNVCTLEFKKKNLHILLHDKTCFCLFPSDLWRTLEGAKWYSIVSANYSL